MIYVLNLKNRNKMKDLLEIAKQILDVNPNASLTGSLMLKIRGIDLGREPHDIDILICDYAPNIVFPDGFKVEDAGHASDGSGAKYRHDDIIIDVLSNGEEPEIYNGWKLGTVEALMRMKYEFSKQDNENAKKHNNDLVKMIEMRVVREQTELNHIIKTL